MIPISDRRSSLSWSLAGAAGVFLVLWLWEFPKPMMDDLFYAGAGLNLAAGGDFSNPYLAGQEFPSHYFFVYTPLHSYVLAGWLKVFGISTASMTGFQGVMFFVIAASTLFLLRRHEAPAWLEWLVPLGVCAAFLRGGLRVEALATALTMAGLAWIACGRRGPGAVFGSFLLMFLGASASPRLALFSMTLAASAGWQLWRSHGSAAERRRIFLMMALAALLTGLAFLVMIQFRLREFLVTFRFHAAGALAREGGLWHRLVLFLGALGVTVWPLVLLLPVFVFLKLRRPRDELTVAVVALCGILPIAFVMGFLTFGSGWYFFLILLFAVPGIVRNASRVASVGLALALALACLAGISRPLVGLFGTMTGRISEKEVGDRAAVIALQPVAGHRLLVDTYAARYAFDYRIPQNFLCLEFGAPFPRYLILDVDFPPEDVFLLGPAGVHDLCARGLRNEEPDTWLPFGPKRWAFYRYPRKISIIPASSCNRTSVDKTSARTGQ